MRDERFAGAQIKYDLWDVEINRYLGQFEDESEALDLVLTLVSHYGAAYADDLELGGVTAEGETAPSLSGAALITRAEQVLSRIQHESHAKAKSTAQKARLMA